MLHEKLLGFGREDRAAVFFAEKAVADNVVGVGVGVDDRLHAPAAFIQRKVEVGHALSVIAAVDQDNAAVAVVIDPLRPEYGRRIARPEWLELLEQPEEFGSYLVEFQV